MGYDLHVTRRDFWADEDGPRISEEEWLTLVAADPELRLDGGARVDLPDGGTLGYEDGNTAVWTAWSGNEPAGGNQAWIWWFEGNVQVKNPDEEIVGKLWRIAQALGARVQGDDGELYAEDGSVIGEDAPPPPPPSARPWWKFW